MRRGRRLRRPGNGCAAAPAARRAVVFGGAFSCLSAGGVFVVGRFVLLASPRATAVIRGRRGVVRVAAIRRVRPGGARRAAGAAAPRRGNAPPPPPPHDALVGFGRALWSGRAGRWRRDGRARTVIVAALGRSTFKGSGLRGRCREAGAEASCAGRRSSGRASLPYALNKRRRTTASGRVVENAARSCGVVNDDGPRGVETDEWSSRATATSGVGVSRTGSGSWGGGRRRSIAPSRSRRPPPRGPRPSMCTRRDAATRDPWRRRRVDVAARGETRCTDRQRGPSPLRTTGGARHQRRQHVGRRGRRRSRCPVG